MAKIYTYGSMRTAPIEYIATNSTTLDVGDLAVLTSGKIAAASTAEPTYLVVGKVDGGKVPVVAILDDMVLESATPITGFEAVAPNRYRKNTLIAIADLDERVTTLEG